MSEPKILFVDDEPNVLSSFRRQFHKVLNMAVAEGGEKALDMIEKEGPFAVIVSDMNMPGMNGVEFLKSARINSPDTVRIMLTGNADQQTAVEAVNEGEIFRFLNKPCDQGNLLRAVEGAIEQHQLITAEKELLEKTLSGSVKVLLDVVSMLRPEALKQAEFIRHWAFKFAKHLGVEKPWQVGMAASLTTLGTLTIPDTVLRKARQGDAMSEGEQLMIDQSPETAKNLIENIPRLKPVGEIIYYQNKGFDGSGFPEGEVFGVSIPSGARVLKILNDLNCGRDAKDIHMAFERLKENRQLYDPDMLDKLSRLFTPKGAGTPTQKSKIVLMPLVSLAPGCVLHEDILTQSGKVFIAAGTELNMAQIVSLKNLMKVEKLGDKVKITRSE